MCRDARNLRMGRDARNLDVSLERKGIGFLTQERVVTQERVLTQGISDRPSNSTGDEPTNSGTACCSTTSESRIGLKSDRRQPPSSDTACCRTTSEPRTDPLNPTDDKPANSSTALLLDDNQTHRQSLNPTDDETTKFWHSALL
jgi:hypothetical protein